MNGRGAVVPGPGIGVIVVAAGSGTRLRRDRPKALVNVGSRSILEHALQSVFGMGAEAQVIVVVPSAQHEEASALCHRAAAAARSTLSVVSGGSSRQESVRAGLAALDPGVQTVLVHDAARAFTPSDQFDRVAGAVASTGGGVVPCLPVTDTIKQADADGTVLGTLDRNSLVAVQTPQGFPRGQLADAYARANREHTDDAALFSEAGGTVTVIPGSPLAFKITTEDDLHRAEALAAGTVAPPSAPAEQRSGIGVDVHAFDPGVPLWLGGLHWPGEAGLAGHSDGDAVCHAICDSLLSAAGLGDLGSRFGTTDERFAGAHGDVFIAATLSLLAESGWSVGNVALQVIAARPRLASRRSELEAHLTGLVGAPVSVSATTTDGLGFTGRAEGVAVLATALVNRIVRLSS